MVSDSGALDLSATALRPADEPRLEAPAAARHRQRGRDGDPGARAARVHRSVIAFYFIALLMIASALTVVLHRNPIYSALGLVNTLFLIAVAFVTLDAELIAMLQVIVYAGAIVILFLF